jgi:dTDP-4-dehydrorhamnose 3,5-epimerase
VKVEPLSIEGAWECIPQVHADTRGSFLEWFRGDALQAATRRRFDVVQANHSVSRRGVVRGIHFADVPPGQAKYVYCAAGAALDVVVDLRIGSPTFGQSTSVVIDDVERRGVFVSEGLGHGFLSLRDDTAVCYLINSVYQPAVERAINPFDAELALPWHEHVDEPMASDRDLAAPTLQQVLADGQLPTYQASLARYSEDSL